MKIDCQNLNPSVTTFSYPVRWCFKQCEDFTFSSKSDCIKICGIVILILGIVSIIWRKACQSKPLSPKTGEQSPTVLPKTLNVNTIKPYDAQAWNTLREDVEVTEENLKYFINYNHEADDNTILEAHALNVKFFYANCDAALEGQGSEDLSWGCAWRSIQTCLSSFFLFYTFQSLFDKYRIDQSNSREWAEPGYGRRICEELKISSELYLYKKELGTSKTPTEWCKKLGSFSILTEKLHNHFQQFHTPVMVDDTLYAFSILGIKSTSKGNVILWIADPHKKTREAGLYCLVFDSEGNKIHSSGEDNGTNGLRTAQQLDPKKGWMLFFPTSPITD